MKKILLLLLPCFTYAVSPSITAIEQAMNQGNIEQVEQMSKVAVAEHPNSAKAHYFLGQAYLNENKFNLSYAELSNAQKLDPTLKFTKNPEMFKEMLFRSKKSSSSPILQNESKKSETINSNDKSSDWLQYCLIALGVVLGAVCGFNVLIKARKKSNVTNDSNPAFYLDDELDIQLSNRIQRTEKSVTLKEKTQESLTYKKELWNLPRGLNSRSGMMRQSNERFTNQGGIAGSNSDLLTGLAIGSILSNSGHRETIINNNETIVNDSYLSDTNSSGDMDLNIKSDEASIFDSSTLDDSWSESSDLSTPFDSSANSGNW